MSSRRSDDSMKIPVVLTGLNLAISIAREATDAVPIVKQSLGAAIRIIALAEKIDRDREALHALADKSLQLAERVKDVMDGRTPDKKISNSLQRIIRAFDSIEAFMAKHVARSRVRRAISYTFTVPQKVERLSHELADAVQELVLVALLDLNHESHAAHALVQENARYVGEFRLLRDCEVDKLDPVVGPGSCLGVRYHQARVDGQLVIVRYFEETESPGSPVEKRRHQELYKEMTTYDRIIEELSTVRRSHRNIARIYGWGQGSIDNRFVVFKAGSYPVYDLLSKLPTPIASLLQWAVKDATHHLLRQGVFWNPHNPLYALDEHLEPTIGLYNDLRRGDPAIDWESESAYQVAWVVHPLWYALPLQEVASTDVRAAVADCHNEQLTGVLGKFETIRRRRCVISKANLLHGFVLNDGTAERLIRVLAEDVCDDGWGADAWMWAGILLALDRNRSHRLQTGLRVIYFSSNKVSDWLEVYGLSEDSESIVYDRYYLEIPDSQRDEIRAMLGIPATSEEEPERWRIIATGGLGTYRAVE